MIKRPFIALIAHLSFVTIPLSSPASYWFSHIHQSVPLHKPIDMNEPLSAYNNIHWTAKTMFHEFYLYTYSCQREVCILRTPWNSSLWFFFFVVMFKNTISASRSTVFLKLIFLIFFVGNLLVFLLLFLNGWSGWFSIRFQTLTEMSSYFR